MMRASGWILAAVLVVGLGSTAQAQMPAGNSNGTGVYGDYYGSQPFGGFGFDYAQTIPSNSYVLDRWWMVTATPSVATPPPSTTAEPAPAARTTTRAGTRRSTRTSVRAPQTFQLPTGSLSWPEAAGVSWYTPAQRYVSYDTGYARSPYGSTDYGMAYKGYSWGY